MLKSVRNDYVIYQVNGDIPLGVIHAANVSEALSKCVTEFGYRISQIYVVENLSKLTDVKTESVL